MKTTTVQRLANTLRFLSDKSERQMKFINTWEPILNKLVEANAAGSPRPDLYKEIEEFIDNKISSVQEAHTKNQEKIQEIKEALAGIPVEE